MRLWLISMMLTPASWNLAVIAASAPGRSWAAMCKPRDPPLPDKIAHQNVGEQMRVDVAAAKDRSDLLPGEALRVAEHRRKPRRAGAFDDALLDRDEHGHGALELALLDQLNFDAKILRGSGW